ncbi:DUF4190 domain-containing protein [Nocardioides jejuensis]|uniref:DUF4190 domain-containing protein n=1 Tax=Nocardioides jejuensis TaxID=2502782 RepID=A0A4R1C1M5_9ACTN|nr:DUF4190 domain-containing protein [Nocardioides jejuensis]TCJ23626.1 DUF4190 domain-containing protein [Nocardioides jejuensis]
MTDLPPPPPGGPPPPPPYGYSTPQYGGAPTEHPQAQTIFVLGIVSLALGAVGIFCCAFLGLVGLAPLLMSNSALREIEASGGALTGADKVRNGRLMGIIALALCAVGVVVGVVIGVGLGMLGGTSGV